MFENCSSLPKALLQHYISLQIQILFDSLSSPVKEEWMCFFLNEGKGLAGWRPAPTRQHSQTWPFSPHFPQPLRGQTLSCSKLWYSGEVSKRICSFFSSAIFPVYWVRETWRRIQRMNEQKEKQPKLKQWESQGGHSRRRKKWVVPGKTVNKLNSSVSVGETGSQEQREEHRDSR